MENLVCVFKRWNGNARAQKHFKNKCPELGENTVRSFKPKYLSLLATGVLLHVLSQLKCKIKLQKFVMDSKIMKLYYLLMRKTYWKYGMC